MKRTAQLLRRNEFHGLSRVAATFALLRRKRVPDFSFRISRLAIPILVGLLVVGCQAPRPVASESSVKPGAAPGEAASAAEDLFVQLVPGPDRVTVRLGGEVFTEYHFANVPKPVLYPVIGPTGLPMTRHYPMREEPGEDQSHPHHRSVWFAHGLVNGHDFWTERPGSGRIVHRGFSEMRGGAEQAVLRSHNDWISADGRVQCADERTLIFHRGTAGARWLDFIITLRATNGELVLGDTREGTFAVRVAETMRVPRGTGGRIENSEGQTDLGAWGRRARWCDYSGPVGGGLAGITILDHPANPRHPTWWMARDYGLLAANAFGQHEFERLADERAGELRVPAGEAVTFRYRLLLHAGELDRVEVENHFAAFAREVR